MTRLNRIKIITNILNSNGFKLNLEFETDKTYGYYDREHDVYIGFDGSDAYSDARVINEYINYIGPLIERNPHIVSFPYFIRLTFDILAESLHNAGIKTEIPLEEMFKDDMDIFEPSDSPHGFKEDDVLPASFVNMGLNKLQDDLSIRNLNQTPEVILSLQKIAEKMKGRELEVYPAMSFDDQYIVLTDIGFWADTYDDGTINLVESQQMNQTLLEAGIDGFGERLDLIISNSEEEKDDEDEQDS